MRRMPALLLCTLIGIGSVSAQEMRVYTEGETNFAPSTTRFELTTETDEEIAEIRYRINDGEAMLYEEPLQFPEEGRYEITYASVDAAGVTSQEETYSVVIDDTAPAITATARGAAMVGDDTTYLRSNTELQLQATDSASGVAEIFVSLDNENFEQFSEPVSFPREGRYRGYAYAVDNVGNRSPTVTLAVVVDDTPPTTRIIPRQPMATVRGTRFATTGSTFAVHAEDTGSGVSRVEVSVDGTDFQEFTEPVQFDEPGEHTLQARAIDHAGNESTVAQLSFVVDEALPQPSVDTLLE
ncbi:MAG: Ig-like domain repeat protein [Alkalispirochaeta sp.]